MKPGIKQKSKRPAGAPGNFNYVFTCTKNDGTKTEFKLTAGNDNEAKHLAKVECQESKAGQFLKMISTIDQHINGQSYLGFKYPDNNFTGHILLVESKDAIYSFNQNDITKETTLPDGKVSLEIRKGSVAYRCNLLIVGKEELSFQNITDNLLPPLPVYKKGDPKPANKNDIAKIKKLNPLARTLASVAANWTMPNGGCALGNTPPNNCAHYLSDAFIKAGYTELLKRNGEGQGIFFHWCDIVTPPNTVNPEARPIRAKQMWEWFKTMATISQTTKPANSGFWAVFQADAVYPTGHVLLYDSNNRKIYGTGVYWDWAEQYFYQW
ncbi:MAG: hypothetical protein ABIN94_22770 [Ferruginibacter sp.]